MPGLPAARSGQAATAISHQAAIFHLWVPAQDTAPVKLLPPAFGLATVTVLEKVIRNVIVILHRAHPILRKPGRSLPPLCR